MVISSVITQLAWMAYQSPPDELNSTDQEGFLLAQVAMTLKSKNIPVMEIADHLKRYRPSEFLTGPANGNKWTKNTIDRLIDQYHDKFSLK